MWQLLEELVALDTATGASCIPAAERVADRLDRPGWTVRVEREPGEGGVEQASVVAWAGPPEPDGLVLSGHLDVVPWADQPGWTRDPLRLEREGGRAYGRGVADMKGAVAQYVALAGALDPASLERPLVLALTHDEELGCLGAGRLAPRLPALLDGCPLPRAALIGEPTAGRAFSAHKGHVHLKVRVSGRGGHSSRPDLGVNAIAAMAEAARAVAALESEVAARTGEVARRLFPDFPAVPFNLGVIRGGTADNMIAEACELTVGFRPGPGETPEGLLAELEARVRAAVAASHPGAEVTFDEPVVTPGMTSPESGPVPDALREVAGVGGLVGAPFATDGGQLERVGVRSYIWGPGELEQAHQPDESIPVAALAASLEQLARLVRRLTGARQA